MHTLNIKVEDDEFAELVAWGRGESRSASNLALHLIRLALEARMGPRAPPVVKTIATTKGKSVDISSLVEAARLSEPVLPDLPQKDQPYEQFYTPADRRRRSDAYRLSMGRPPLTDEKFELGEEWHDIYMTGHFVRTMEGERLTQEDLFADGFDFSKEPYWKTIPKRRD